MPNTVKSGIGLPMVEVDLPMVEVDLPTLGHEGLPG
jgi:hypothetical protein